MNKDIPIPLVENHSNIDVDVNSGLNVNRPTGTTCYDRDNRLRSKTLSMVREVGSGLYLNKQNASDEVLSVLK